MNNTLKFVMFFNIIGPSEYSEPHGVSDLNLFVKLLWLESSDFLVADATIILKSKYID